MGIRSNGINGLVYRVTIGMQSLGRERESTERPLASLSRQKTPTWTSDKPAMFTGDVGKLYNAAFWRKSL
jgi:hypothetical protein